MFDGGRLVRRYLNVKTSGDVTLEDDTLNVVTLNVSTLDRDS